MTNLRSEYDETLLKNGVRGKYAKQSAEMRARLASFAEDWENLEMDVYDNYDEEKAKLQTRC